jgi:LuxR family maltose regulon positive regulatory protein
MEPEVSFGAWISQQRKALDLTREQLAQCVGCSVSALRKIEADERRPSRQMAELLADCLEIPPDQHPTLLQVARGQPRVEWLATAKPGRLNAQPDWLAQTKLHAPHLREDLIPRQHLLRAFYDALVSHPLTLLSAPAGYGKTTLLATLPSAFPELHLAWLSLDEDDNDPARFLAALIIALQVSNPAGGATAQILLASLTNPAAEMRRVIDVLINDMLQNQAEAYLVLDDLHLITEPAVYAMLNYLLERLPPSMHLAVATRHDPPLSLARLRARGQLAELRLPDLRFTLDEAGLFLNEKLHLGLSHDDLAALQSRAEGWAAGLRLLAGSLDRIQAPADRSVFIQHMVHSDRYVFDFLAEEVLKRQEPEIQTFLLETSILPELTPSLCEAVTGRSDAQTVLEDLYRRNLFLVEMSTFQPEGGGAGSAFRYHALFAEFLRGRLALEMPGHAAELHRRAANAYGGIAPSRSVAHFLAAEMWDAAAGTVEQVGGQLVQQGLLDSVRGWILALPAPVREARPRLSYLLGICARQRGDLELAQSLLTRALRDFEAIGDEAGQGEALMELANVASGLHDYELQAPLIRQALARPLPPHGRVQLLIIHAWRALYQGDWAEVEANVAEAIQVTLESGEPGAFNVLALQLRGTFLLLPGGMERLEHYCRQALSRFGDGVGPVQAGAHSLLGHICLVRGRLNEAMRETRRALSLSAQLGGYVYVDNEVDIVATLASWGRGDYAGVERHWKARWPRVEATPAARPWLVSFLSYIGRSQWMQGRLEEAHQTFARVCDAVTPQDLPEASIACALMRSLLEISDRRYAEAERTLRRALEIQDKFRHTPLYGNARSLLAYLYLQWNHPEDALAELSLVLSECERQGMPGLILQEGVIMPPLLRLTIEQRRHVDFATQLLDTFHTYAVDRTPRPVPVPETGETLTSREVEVLLLIAAGASNRAIADQLVVSERTVKSHITHILGKLGVSSRTQAAARARELRLV